MIGKRIAYRDEQQALEGYLAAPDSASNIRAVLIIPSWLNVNKSICSRADRLAKLGYTVFVADLFGAGVRPHLPQSPPEVIAPLLNDRLFNRRRLFAGLKALQSRPECDVDRIAAIGY